MDIPLRPDIRELEESLKKGDEGRAIKNMVNVLENFTLKSYPVVVYTKNKMQEKCNCSHVMMSGSGPTVFGLCKNREEALCACAEMKEINEESFWTRTSCK